MRTDTEGLLYILTTLRTFLRGVVRGNGNHLTLSTFSLSFKQLSEYPPGCIGKRESQTMVPYHVGNFQVFNGNGLIAVDIIVGSFMEGILTLVRNVLMDTSDLVLGFLVSLATLLTPGKCALSLSKSFRTLLRMFGVLNNVPIAICNQIPDAHIQPNGIVLLRQRLRGCFANALQIPTRGAQDNTGKLERPFQRAMDNHADTSAHLLWCLEIPIVQAVNCITKLNGIPGLRILEARKPNFPTVFEATEEVGEGTVKTFEGGINNHSRQIRMCLFAMVLVLLIEMQILARFFVMHDQLFQAGIIHLARCYQHAHQGLLLLLIGSHAVLKCLHSSSIAVSDYIVKSYGLKPQGNRI